jgi:diguanylate cyclase (GGDEF)-like protein
MKDADKTKKQLIEEISAMRQQVAEQEASGSKAQPSKEPVQKPDTKVKALYSIAQITSTTLNLDDLLKNSLEEVIGVVEAGAGSIYLLDRDQNIISLKAQRGMVEGGIEEVSNLGLTEANIPNLRQWKDLNTPLSEMIGNEQSDAISKALGVKQKQAPIAIPISAQGQVRGLIILGSPKEPKLTSDDFELLQAMSCQIAMGVENSILLEKAQELSLSDELTGLYNRRYFYVVLHNEMHRAQRYGPSSSLVMLDLDGFKKYNEEFGHTAGDSALKALAQTLIEELRKTDMAFRYGGDEFMIVLPATEADNTSDVIDRIRAKWSQVSRAQYTVQESVLGLSAGIVQFPRDADTADGLVLLAETSLQESRRGGGNKSTLAAELGVVHTEMGDTITVDQVHALAATVDARDPFAYGHWERVASVSDIIGKAVELSDSELADLHTAALLHDIGKVNVSDSIVTKSEELSESEWEIMRRHSTEGAQIISGVQSLSALSSVIRHHHESYDGTGYPDV